MTKQIAIHLLKVAAHILVAALVIGLVTLLDKNPQISQGFIQGLENFGIPVSIANLAIAGGIKYLQLRAASLQQ